MIKPGMLSSQQADELNEVLRFVQGLRNLSVLPPLRKIPGPNGQNIITIDTSNFLRVTLPSNSGSISGSGSSTDASPTIVLGTVVTGQQCIDGVLYQTTMDVVSNDGFFGFENEQTRGVSCCGCGCACEPVFYRYARFTFSNRTGDMVAALPDTYDLTFEQWSASPACLWASANVETFGQGAWANQFQINPAFTLSYAASPYSAAFGIDAPNVGSSSAGTATDGPDWASVASGYAGRNFSVTQTCGVATPRYVGRYSLTALGGESHPGTGEFDLYVDLIE